MIYYEFFMMGVKYGFLLLGLLSVFFSVYYIALYFKTIRAKYKRFVESK